jgi:hypothetical protein
VSDAYGHRVNDRLRLLTGLLRSPDWECQLDALYPAGTLIAGWRGDYQELVAVIGERIHDGHPRPEGPSFISSAVAQRRVDRRCS